MNVQHWIYGTKSPRNHHRTVNIGNIWATFGQLFGSGQGFDEICVVVSSYFTMAYGNENFILYFRDAGEYNIRVPAEPSLKTRWVVDLPPREAMRLGSFRTKEEALDYRREYIIRAIRTMCEHFTACAC